MKKITSTKKRSLPVIIAVTLLVLMATSVALAYSLKLGPFSSSTQNDVVTQEEKRQAELSDSQNQQTKDDQSDISKSENVDTTKSTDEIPPSASTSIDILQLNSENDVVTYEAQANGQQTGTCSATFTSSRGKPVIRNSETTNGMCQASIPVMEFDALGPWTLTLRYYTDNKQSTATREVIIN